MLLLRKYYFDVTIYNLTLSLLVGAYAGVVWALLIFGTIGTVVGFIVYAYFKAHEYYLYYNYGYSKRMLMLRVWGANVAIALASLGVYAIIVNLLK